MCPKCLANAFALKIRTYSCPSCGLPLHNFEPGSRSLCLDCILNPPPYSGARSFGFYSGDLARLIHGFKFLGRRNLSDLLAPLLLETFYENWDCDDFDLLLPVPLHRRRRRKRGYNQSELLARALARKTGIAIEGGLLKRVRPTLSQVGLKDAQRRDNVRNAFRCGNPAKISGRRVLLVDDVLTTGATAGSASSALLKAGALRVSVLALARTE